MLAPNNTASNLVPSDSVPENARKVQLSVRIAEHERVKIQREAAANLMSMTDYVRLKLGLARIEKEKEKEKPNENQDRKT